MNDYITIQNDYYDILIPKVLKKYGKEILEFSTNKFKEYLIFFNEQSYGKKIKGAFLITRDDFIQRIKEVAGTNSKLPPSWASGCFYGGEIQILIKEDKPYDRFNTLAHETFHLLFQKYVYEKNNWDRITWLDESLATNFDGTTEILVESGKFKEMVSKIINISSLPRMSDLSFKKGNVKTLGYNGYDLFKIVGRYLIETFNDDELLEYINNKDKICEDGNNILEKSLKYFL